jgi:hypothetical protein
MRLIARQFLLFACVVGVCPVRADDPVQGDVPPKPMSPEASRDSIRVRPGFKVELMAAEPLVLDPIAFAFGADGKLWVVEMGDYPLGVKEDQKVGERPAGAERRLPPLARGGKGGSRDGFCGLPRAGHRAERSKRSHESCSFSLPPREGGPG